MSFSPVVVGSGIAGYEFIKRTRDQQLGLLAHSPAVARDIAYFKANISTIKTADDLLDDWRMLSVALGAFGLGEDIGNRAFLKRVFESDLTDPQSPANLLSDKRYQQLAKTFNFGGSDGARLPGSSVQDDMRNQLRQVGSAQVLLGNANLLNRTLEAFGLEGDAGRKVFLERVLTSDMDDPRSLANRLGNARYIELANAFQGRQSTDLGVFIGKVSEDMKNRLGALQSADDLLRDPSLLRSALKVFGLEGQARNTAFLKAVLESDLSDPASPANRINTPALRELAEAFDFGARAVESASIYRVAALFEDRLDGLNSADDLLGDAELLNAATQLFGLDNTDQDFLRQVLDSDLLDAQSFANQQAPEYVAFARAFGFGEMLGGTPQDEAKEVFRTLIQETNALPARPEDAAGVFTNIRFMLAVTDFFDLPAGASETAYAQRILDSTQGDPLDPLAYETDKRYLAFHAAFPFAEKVEGQTYPDGFAEAVTETYLQRQFELQVGEVDSTLQLALAMERELGTLVNQFSSNNARWFGAIGAGPVRSILGTALNLTTSFGQIDVDLQLTQLKQISQSTFGTDQLADFLEPDRLADLRNRFLTNSLITTQANPESGFNPVASLLGVR